jgi:hypothetical protein
MMTALAALLIAATATPAAAGDLVTIDNRRGAIVTVDVDAGEVIGVTAIKDFQAIGAIDHLLIDPSGGAWFTSGARLYSLDLCSGAWERQGLLDVSDACAMEVDADDNLVSIDADEDAMITLDGATGQRLSELELGGDVQTCGMASDGEVVYGVASVTMDNEPVNLLMDSEGDGWIELTIPAPASAAAWDADSGELIVGAGRSLYRVDPVSGESQRVASLSQVMISTLAPAPVCE